METIDLLLGGLAAALTLNNLLATLLGVLLGLAVGVMPALGPPAAIAILLPAVVQFEPAAAMAGLAGIYYGAMYGGSVTSILLGIPGESASVITAIDGHPMARRGEAGRALGISIFASFFGSFIAILLFTLISAPFASYAVRFGPAEMTALMVMALSFTTALGGSNPWKGFLSLGIGLWIGMIGLDMITGAPRYTFGATSLLDGVAFPVIAIGLYGLGELLSTASDQADDNKPLPQYTFRSLFPRLRDIILTWRDLTLGSLVGFVVGVFPGAGTAGAPIFSYALSKKFSKEPEKFGKGAIEGVASAESANNAASFSAMIPLFSLGIPGTGTTAVLLGGLLMLGLQPGPLLFQERPDFVWPVIGSFYIGNVMLVILTILLIPVLASIVYVPLALLLPVISGIVVYGVYSISNSIFDIWLALMLGALGYFMLRLKYPLIPALLGVVLGPIMEQNIRRALISSEGDFMIFLERPISLALLSLTAGLVLLPLIQKLTRRRKVDDEASTELN